MFKGRVTFSNASALNSVFQGLQLTEMAVLVKNFQTIDY